MSMVAYTSIVASYGSLRCACADESQKRRDALSLRSAPPGSRVVAFRKENAATQGLQLGLKFRESFGKSVYIEKILPGTQAAAFEAQGKLQKGDEITMVSATFGDEASRPALLPPPSPSPPPSPQP